MKFSIKYNWIDLFGYKIILLTPKDMVLFSERNNIRVPVLKAFGYRLFVVNINHL